ncbi:hypothetical protein D3C72_1733620 [compost metagenome]
MSRSSDSVTLPWYDCAPTVSMLPPFRSAVPEMVKDARRALSPSAPLITALPVMVRAWVSSTESAPWASVTVLPFNTVLALSTARSP